MDTNTIQQIMTPVIAFLGSATGATIIGVVIKSIVSAVATYKTKKVSKLTEADKAEIAEKVTQNVLTAMQDGVSINAEAMLEKYTNGRISALESKFNEAVTAQNKDSKRLGLVLKAVGSFKSLANTLTANEINDELKEETPCVEPLTAVDDSKITFTAPESVEEVKVAY